MVRKNSLRSSETQNQNLEFWCPLFTNFLSPYGLEPERNSLLRGGLCFSRWSPLQAHGPPNAESCTGFPQNPKNKHKQGLPSLIALCLRNACSAPLHARNNGRSPSARTLSNTMSPDIRLFIPYVAGLLNARKRRLTQ